MAANGAIIGLPLFRENAMNRYVGRLLLGVSLIGINSAYSQPNGVSQRTWKPLTDEVPRGTLFQTHLADLKGDRSSTGVPYAFPAKFHFAHDAMQDIDGSDRRNTLFGIDISHYQVLTLPFKDFAHQKISFVYTKATQGITYADETFGHNWKALASLPIDPRTNRKEVARGAYHFLSSDIHASAAAQAQSFFDYVTKNGGFSSDDLSPAVDLEWDVACKTCRDRWNDRKSADIIEEVAAFVTAVKTLTKRSPIVYTNKVFLKQHGISTDDDIRKLLNGAKAWIFDLDGQDRKIELPNPENNISHTLWQFTFSAQTGTTYKGDVDADVFKGTDAQFVAALLNPRD